MLPSGSVSHLALIVLERKKLHGYMAVCVIGSSHPLNQCVVGHQGELATGEVSSLRLLFRGLWAKVDDWVLFPPEHV